GNLDGVLAADRRVGCKTNRPRSIQSEPHLVVGRHLEPSRLHRGAGSIERLTRSGGRLARASRPLLFSCARQAGAIQPQGHQLSIAAFSAAPRNPRALTGLIHLFADGLLGSRNMKTVLSMLVAVGTLAATDVLAQAPASVGQSSREFRPASEASKASRAARAQE